MLGNYAFAAFAFLMPALIARRCPCDLVFVHPLGHTKRSTSVGLPRRSGKSFGTRFREQQRQVGQRRVPSTSMTPSSGSKTHVRRMGRSGISELSIYLIDVIFITLSLKRTLSQFCSGHPGPGHAERLIRSEQLECCSLQVGHDLAEILAFLWRRLVFSNGVLNSQDTE